MAILPQLAALLRGAPKAPKVAPVTGNSPTSLDFLPHMPQMRPGVKMFGGVPVAVKPSRNKRLPKEKVPK